MAPQNAKRTSGSEKAAPAAKKTKVDATLKPIVEALEHREACLPEATRKMLLAALPGCLGVDYGSRHTLQSGVADMIGEVIHDVQAKLKASIEEVETTIATLENRKKDEESAFAALEAALKEAKQTAVDSKVSLGESQKAKASAEAEIVAKEKMCNAAGEALAKLQTSKEELETCITVHLQAIVKCDDESKYDGDAPYKAILPILKTITLDSSLLTALPTCCAKTPANRGGFDKMVLEELEKTLAARSAELEKQLSEAKSSYSEIESALKEAESSQEALAASHKKAADAQTLALDAQLQASTKVDTARVTLANQAEEYHKAQALCNERSAELENFQVFTVESFEVLNSPPEVKESLVQSTEVAKVPSEVAQMEVCVTAGGA